MNAQVHAQVLTTMGGRTDFQTARSIARQVSSDEDAVRGALRALRGRGLVESQQPRADYIVWARTAEGDYVADLVRAMANSVLGV
jgi:DNA-binding FadR family transcriptional regulator